MQFVRSWRQRAFSPPRGTLWNMAARDVFISYARYDGDQSVAMLVDELRRRGISYWLDDTETQPGGSLAEAISDGLKLAAAIVFFVTPHYLETKGWRHLEANAATARLAHDPELHVVPVLTVPHEDFAARFPLLADRVALTWASGTDVVADAIGRLFPRKATTEWHTYHPEETVGRVWVRLLPTPGAVGKAHELTFRWGPYAKRLTVTPTTTDSISFEHHKTEPDSVALLVEVHPAAVITFGQGEPPDRPPMNIDEGWTRAAGGTFPGHL
jgi:hypothetical protein